MKVDSTTVLVTGAICGLGLAFARKALARGARKVQAVARVPARLKPESGKPALDGKRSRTVNPAVFLDVLRLDA